MGPVVVQAATVRRHDTDLPQSFGVCMHRFCVQWASCNQSTVDTEIKVKLIPPTYFFAFAFAFF